MTIQRLMSVFLDSVNLNLSKNETLQKFLTFKFRVQTFSTSLANSHTKEDKKRQRFNRKKMINQQMVQL